MEINRKDSFNPLQAHKKPHGAFLFALARKGFNPLQAHKKHQIDDYPYNYQIMFQSPIGTQKTKEKKGGEL